MSQIRVETVHFETDWYTETQNIQKYLQVFLGKEGYDNNIKRDNCSIIIYEQEELASEASRKFFFKTGSCTLQFAVSIQTFSLKYTEQEIQGLSI